MKLAGEMVCVVSLAQAPPRKQTLHGMSSLCSTENSHRMERLIKEPEAHTLSRSCRSTAEVSIEATEKSINSRQISRVPELPAVESFRMAVNSAFELPPKKESKIIPIFKGRLMQMNGKTTHQMDGKRRPNAERHSLLKMTGVPSPLLSVCKSSKPEVYKPVQNMSVKNLTHAGTLQVMNTKTDTKQTIPVFQWKTESGGQMTGSYFSGTSASGGNSSKVNQKKSNSPSFLKNVGSVLQKPNISLTLNSYSSPLSSARGGRKVGSQNTMEVLEKKHQSKKGPLQICELDNEMTNFGLSQHQTKRSNEGAGLNIHESVLNDTMHITKNEDDEAAWRSKDYIAKTTSRHSKSNLEQVQ